ncbi:hypothetical protein [Nannocystis punicea]|uniref:VWFA domain-containing protein n=1 Tax=Nannocystis punicea TaxID=2995304 RepID=A0ABY7HA86_9BACT|nr:hypothetical protein [Nannocystis poenicansa]WAS96193.1 hypothetical protein O0S08_08520 [Nannocystis poenicansa]
MHRPPTLPALALLLVAACGESDGRDTTTAAQPTTQPTGVSTAPATDVTATGDTATGDTASTTTGTSGTGTSAPTSSEPATTSEPTATSGPGAKFDIGNQDLGDTGTTGAAKGCNKVDFLFVIDNSTSMEDNQDALIDSFPGFIDAIKNTLVDVDDYHIMVVDTDADGRCAQPCDPGDPDYVKFCYEENYHACTTMLDECDTIRGAGVLHPVGTFATNAKCPVAGGHRYMLPDQPDLPNTFACVAKVGTAGSPSERPMNAIEEAVSEALNVPNGCNGGFLRDDAILVITFISDDPNSPDQGEPPDWKASIVAAKNGDENAVVVLGLIPHPELGCTTGNDPMSIQGAHWEEFIQMWGPHGISGSVCEADYAPFFLQAIGAIDQTCDEFDPPG